MGAIVKKAEEKIYNDASDNFKECIKREDAKKKLLRIFHFFTQNNLTE